MMNIRKPLHPYAQSMLLSAMLFDRDNLNEILNFFPADQNERMHAAKNKFMTLSRNERMTQIVLEMRRLLLIDENRIDWIHKSWITDALSKEPPYLRELINDAIADKSAHDSSNQDPKSGKLPSSLIFSMFASQLIKAPQKTAIFDPVLMRLQSLKYEAQEEILALIGQFSLSLLSQKIDGDRLTKFLVRRGLRELPPFTMPSGLKNFMEHEQVKKHFLQELIQHDKNDPIDCLVISGTLTVALYLLNFKHQWQRAIALCLHIKLGQTLERMIKRAKGLKIDQKCHGDIAHFLQMSLDQLKA